MLVSWRGRRNRQRRVAASPRNGANAAVDYVGYLLCTLANPSDVVAEYLRRPVRGARLYRLVAQIARGETPLLSRGPLASREEIQNRAGALVNWLDGKDAAAKTPYDVLGLNRSASAIEIQRRYRQLSKRTHPDLHPASNIDYWQSRQREVNEAYKALTDAQAGAEWLARVEERNRLLRRLREVELIHLR